MSKHCRAFAAWRMVPLFLATLSVAAQAAVAPPALGEEPNLPDLVRRIPRLGTAAELPDKTFHLTLEMPATRAKGIPAPTASLTIEIDHARERTAVLVSSGENQMILFATDGWAVTFSRAQPGYLVFAENVWPRVLFKGAKDGVQCEFSLERGAKAAEIEVDAGSALAAVIAEGSARKFDPGGNRFTFGSGEQISFWSFASPNDATDPFPVKSISINTRADMMALREIGTHEPGRRSLLAMRREDVMAMNFPVSTGEWPSSALGQKRERNEQMAANTFSSRFTPDPEAERLMSRRMITQALDRMEAAWSQMDSTGTKSGIRGIDSELSRLLLRTLHHPAQGQTDWRFSRRAAGDKIAEFLGKKETERLCNTLVTASKDELLDYDAQFAVIRLIGDLGVISDEKRLSGLETALKKSPEMGALLNAARVEIAGAPSAEQLAALQVDYANTKYELPTRLACLEAICMDIEAKMPAGTMDILGEAQKNRGTNGGMDVSRWIGSVAATRAGFALMVEDMLSPKPVLPLVDEIRITYELWPVQSAEFGRLAEVVQGLVLRPGLDTDTVDAGVYGVLRRKCDDATIVKLIDEGVKRKNVDLLKDGLMLIQLTDHAIKFLPQIEEAYDAGTPLVKTMALGSFYRKPGMDEGVDCAAALPLLKKALNDEDATIRRMGLGTISNLKAAKCTGLQSLQPVVEKLALGATDAAESRTALFALEKITDGAFKIAGDPREDPNRLGQSPKAEIWWQEHLDDVRKQAREWAKAKQN